MWPVLWLSYSRAAPRFTAQGRPDGVRIPSCCHCFLNVMRLAYHQSYGVCNRVFRIAWFHRTPDVNRFILSLWETPW